MPTKEFAIESISCPLTPKSQSLISPLEFTKMLDGLTSGKNEQIVYIYNRENGKFDNDSNTKGEKHHISLCFPSDYDTILSFLWEYSGKRFGSLPRPPSQALFNYR